MSAQIGIYFIILIALISNSFCHHFNFLSFFTNYYLRQFHSGLPDGQIIDIIWAIQEFIDNYSDVDFLDSPEGKLCYGGDEGIAKIKISSLIDFFSFSGKGISELGLETECYLSKKEELSYYLFTYKYNENSFKSFEDDHDVYQLINQTTFYTGICLFKNCTSFINKMFNKEENKRFFEFLLANESIVNLTVLMGKNECASYEQEVKYGNKLEFIMFLSFLLLISVIFTLQIIIALFKVCCHNKDYSHNSSLQIANQQLLLGDDFDDDEDEEESDIIFANNFGGMSGRPSNNVFGSHPIENAETTNNKEKSCSFSTVINFFNFVSNMTILSTKKNKYYNDKEFEVISFLKMIVLIFMTFYQNFDTLIKIPARDFVNGEFYKNFAFMFIKLSSFAIDSWMSLEGFTMIYKFMYYLKKNVYEKNDNSISLFVLFRFYSRVIVKIIFYIVLYGLMGIGAKYTLWFFSHDSLYKYTITEVYNKDNVEFLKKILIPGFSFILGYDSSIPNELFANNRLLVLFINEFYVFTFMMIVLYIGFKIRSSLYDIIILAVFILNFIGTYFTCVSEKFTDNENYIMSRIIGSVITIRYPHIVLNTYLIGMFTGLVCFYFKDVISKSNIINEPNTYCPFKFCYSILRCIDSCHSWVKLLLLIMNICIIVIISSSFYFLILINGDLLIKLDFPCKLIYYYDRGVFLLFFNFLVILLETYGNESSFKHFMSASTFTSVSRCGFCYCCCLSIFVYGAFILFNFQIKLCYQNLWFISFGLFMFCYVFSLILTFLIEVPLKVLTKNILYSIQGKVEQKRTTNQAKTIANKEDSNNEDED